MTNVTKVASAAVAAAALLVPAGGDAARPSRPCGTVVSTEWRFYGPDGIERGRRYRVDAERLPCLLATRLAAQLIPLRTKEAFARARPAGYVCIALGAGANRHRPTTAVGLCLQKPVASPRDRSFSWRPVRQGS